MYDTEKERNTHGGFVPVLSTSPCVHCLLSTSRTHCPSYHVIHWWLIPWYVGIAKGTAYNHSVASHWRQCTSYSPVDIYMSLLGTRSRKSSDVSYCCYVLWVGRALKHFTERGGGEREGVTERDWRDKQSLWKYFLSESACRCWLWKMKFSTILDYCFRGAYLWCYLRELLSFLIVVCEKNSLTNINKKFLKSQLQ